MGHVSSVLAMFVDVRQPWSKCLWNTHKRTIGKDHILLDHREDTMHQCIDPLGFPEIQKILKKTKIRPNNRHVSGFCPNHRVFFSRFLLFQHPKQRIPKSTATGLRWRVPRHLQGLPGWRDSPERARSRRGLSQGFRELELDFC